MDNSYARAYTEVLEIIRHFPEEDIKKISETKLEFLRMNRDKDYFFVIDPEKDLSEQNISREANAVMVNIYKEFFASEEQNRIIDSMLTQNSLKEERLKREKYNPDDLFKKEEPKVENIVEEQAENVEPKQETTALVEVKEEGFFKRFLAYMRNLIFG